MHIILIIEPFKFKKIKVHGLKNMKNENIKVCVRLKPITEESTNGLNISLKGIQLAQVEYTFDHILRNASQQDLFDSVVKNAVVDYLQGYNCTIFAYGQTGSGKTYTIQGTKYDRGLVQRTLEFIFKNTKNCKICISYVEVYNGI
jgi:hypothetical protein